MSTPQLHGLANISILADLTPEERRDFEMSCPWRRFSPDEQIIDQQEETRDVYFITRGRVRVVSFTLSGKEVALEDLLSGSYFGELAALDGKPRSTRVLAVEDSDIAEISGECFIRVLEKHPQVALKVMRNMAGIICTSTARIIDLSTLGANNRVHGELLRQARAVSSDDNMAILKPIPVQSDMASRASTTRETVARELSNLTKKGILKREKDSLVICDVETLGEMVEDVRG